MQSIVRAGRTSAIVVALLLVLPIARGEAAQRKPAKTTSVHVDSRANPNRSYRAGPRTRVFVTQRSWLDGGTEVRPGERKFNDYAFPPGYSFARENGNRPLDRQPLNPPSDIGGYSQGFPF